MEGNVEKWIADNRMPALEQITLTYGMAQVIIDRISTAAVAVPDRNQAWQRNDNDQ